MALSFSESTATPTGPIYYSNLIDGRTFPAQSHAEVLNPADGSLVGMMPLATQDDLDHAVESARVAFATWSQSPDEVRKKACHDIAAAIAEHTEELAQLLTLEQGKPLNALGSRFELGGASAWAAYTAGLELEPHVVQDDNQGRCVVYRRPIGVVGSITPWNWPVMLGVMHFAPAIRAGNTVIIKPSPLTPLSTIRLVELLNTVLPPGVLNVLAGGNEIGAAMAAHPGIGKIAFTGSTETGRKVMASGASNLKRLTLELGGNDAGIVLPDADPSQIAEGLFWGAFINNGQTCAALKRLYVHESLYEAVCDNLVKVAEGVKVGNGLDDDSVLGPIQNEMQFNKVKALVDKAKAAGGRVIIGGDPDPSQPGYFFPVTLIADLDNGNALVDQEQFGPVLPIIRYTDLDEVIAKANDNPYGLGGSIWTRDLEQGRQLATRLHSGTVWINSHGGLRPDAPFGGVKQSGLGTSFAEWGLHEYTDIQTITG